MVGGWVLKLKLMLTQPPTELELELGLSLAKKLLACIACAGTLHIFPIFGMSVGIAVVAPLGG